jgi:DNA-directed RNA polymerase specialized sigma24 family protein
LTSSIVMLLFFLCEFVGEAFDLAGLQARLGSTNRAQDPLEPRLASDLQPIGRLKVASGWRSDRLTSFLLAMITRRALPSWSAEPHTDETAVTSLSFLASVLAGPRCLVARRDNARTVTLRHLVSRLAAEGLRREDTLAATATDGLSLAQSKAFLEVLRAATSTADDLERAIEATLNLPGPGWWCPERRVGLLPFAFSFALARARDVKGVSPDYIDWEGVAVEAIVQLRDRARCINGDDAGPWFRQMLANLISREVRTQWRLATAEELTDDHAPSVTPDFDGAAAEEDAVGDADDSDLAARLTAMIAGLPPSLRVTAALYLIERLDRDEIRSRLMISAELLRQRITRIHKALKHELREATVAPGAEKK